VLEVDDYLFASTQGWQCRDHFWMMTFSFEQIASLLEPFFNRPKADSPLTLAQRTLDRNRGKKISRYVIKGLSSKEEFYVLTPIVMTFEFPAWDCYEFHPIEIDEDLPDSENLGWLRLPPSTTFWLPDGQHRAFGAIQSRLEAPGLVERETIGVMLEPDTGGKKRNQIFLDSNQYGVKPSKSIITLFDNRDLYSGIARSVLMTVEIFLDRTALEATNIRSNSSDVFTMNSIREASKTFLSGSDGNLEQQAIEFWQTIANYHPDWKQLQATGDVTIRQTSIAFNALTMRAIAIVGQQLRQSDQIDLVQNLDRIDWQLMNPAWDICKLNGRIVKNKSTEQAMANYILERLKQ